MAYKWVLLSTLSTYTSWDDPPSFPGFSSFTVIHHTPCHAIGLGSNTQCSCVSKHRWSEYRPGLEKGEGFGGSGPGVYTNSWMCLKSTGFVFAEFSTHTHTQVTRYKIRKVNAAGTCCKYMPLERKGNDRSEPTKPPGYICSSR